jgi:hypothetical protein
MRWAKKLASVCVHCRRHLQFLFGVSLVVFGFINFSATNIHGHRWNLSAASRGCTTACGAACAQTRFYPEALNVTTSKGYTIPDEVFQLNALALTTRVRRLRVITTSPIHIPELKAHWDRVSKQPVYIKSHTTDVWWIDPHVKTVSLSVDPPAPSRLEVGPEVPPGRASYTGVLPMVMA